MIIKKRITISGRLLFPLEEGYRAAILHKNGVIYTSRVVSILEYDCDHVIFETMNSVYWLLLSPAKAKYLYIANDVLLRKEQNNEQD